MIGSFDISIQYRKNMITNNKTFSNWCFIIIMFITRNKKGNE